MSTGVVDRRGVAAATIFGLICVVFLPAIVAGYLIWIAKLYGGRSKASGTAQGPLSARWMQHRLGTRLDAPAERLLMALPNVSPLAVWLLFGPMLVAHRASGFIPTPFRYPFAGELSIRNQAAGRQTFYDSVVERHAQHIDQYVSLGAGFDTRGLRLPPSPSRRVFDVDRTDTVATKRSSLERAGIDIAAVTFVAVDFETDDWFETLVAEGFDPRQPTLFLWEGVTPYLDRTAVDQVLSKLGSVAGGSIVAFDYLTTEVLQSRRLPLRLVRASLRAGGEPLKFGLDATPPAHQRLLELVQPHGLSVAEHVVIGEEKDSRSLGGLVVATVD